jgi:hypothetical protein
MLNHLFSLLVVALALLSSVSALNLPTLVNLRIEGSTSTIFEGPIITRGHNVSTPSGGNHHCDGTNNKENPSPGPTCTTALDDASELAHFLFDGTFSSQFDDFFITSIGGVSQTSTQFWGILIDFELTPVGGCQQEVKVNDNVLFAFDAFNANAFLKLTGPVTAHVNKPVVLTVKDGQTGDPVAGATVVGQTTDASGHVSVTFTHPGLEKLKATKTGAIRSNQINVIVV